MCFCLCLQIVADIYEPQGIAFVDAHATFLSNELLPLVEKTVTDNKVQFYIYHQEVNCMADYILWSFETEANASLFQAHISFSPTLDQQRKCPECDGSLIDGDFIIKYDVKRVSGLGDIQVCCQEIKHNADFSGATPI